MAQLRTFWGYVAPPTEAYGIAEGVGSAEAFYSPPIEVYGTATGVGTAIATGLAMTDYEWIATYSYTTAEQVKSSYKRMLDQRLIVRRYTGVGTSRPKIDVPGVRARVIGYQPQELVGTVLQGDRRAIVYADDITAGGIAALTTNDKIVQRGRELAIIAVDNSTRRIDDILIAYELQLRG